MKQHRNRAPQVIAAQAIPTAIGHLAGTYLRVEIAAAIGIPAMSTLGTIAVATGVGAVVGLAAVGIYLLVTNK